MNQGQCKVWVPGVYSEEWRFNPDKLPPAEQISPLFAGSSSGNGVFSYPNIGSVVVVGFWNGDANMPFFWGSTLGGPEAAHTYGEARPNVTEQTVKDGKDAYVHVIKSNQTTIKIWEGGHVEVTVKSDPAASDSAAIDMDGKGNVIIRATKQIRLVSPTISVNAGTQLSMFSPRFTNINSVSNTVMSPSIDLNSDTGITTIKGKRHTQVFN